MLRETLIEGVRPHPTWCSKPLQAEESVCGPCQQIPKSIIDFFAQETRQKSSIGHVPRIACTCNSSVNLVSSGFFCDPIVMKITAHVRNRHCLFKTFKSHFFLKKVETAPGK
jgi:hypothetical protein